MENVKDILRQSEYYHQRLMLLNKITTNVIGEKPANELALDMVIEIRKVFEVDSCVVRIIQGDELLLLANAGMPEENLQKSLPIGFGIAKKIIESKIPVTIYNTEEDSVTQNIKRLHKNSYQFLSYAGAPLLIRDRALGILGIFSENEKKVFTTDDLNQLQIAANHLAVAIENSNLFTQISHQKKLLEKEIIDRHNAEIELENALDFTEYIINSIPYTIISFDHEFNINSYNTNASKFASALTVYEYQTGNLFVLFPQLVFLKPFLTDAIGKNTYKSESIAVPNSEGEVNYFRITLIPMMRQKQIGFILIIEDITEKTKMDQHLIQSEKMMSIAGLAAGMAHEINNPLGTIMQGCQNIERRLSRDIPSNTDVAEKLNLNFDALLQYLEVRQIPEILRTIRGATTKASEIIKNMLNFSRSTESKRVSEDIHSLIERVLHLAANDYDMKKKYDFRQIKIVREFQLNPPKLEITITEIEQVLFNLIRNATQALKEENNPNKVPTITIRTNAEGNNFKIEVEDNGPGIKMEIQKRIFEPFFTTKEVGEGTGLGLSVSYMIITTNHNGMLTFESQPGKGTKFIVTIPIEGK